MSVYWRGFAHGVGVAGAVVLVVWFAWMKLQSRSAEDTALYDTCLALRGSNTIAQCEAAVRIVGRLRESERQKARGAGYPDSAIDEALRAMTPADWLSMASQEIEKRSASSPSEPRPAAR